MTHEVTMTAPRLQALEEQLNEKFQCAEKLLALRGCAIEGCVWLRTSDGSFGLAYRFTVGGWKLVAEREHGKKATWLHVASLEDRILAAQGLPKLFEVLKARTAQRVRETEAAIAQVQSFLEQLEGKDL